MSTKENQIRTEEELFHELYSFLGFPDITRFDINSFVKKCEEKYGMDTKRFLEWFRTNGYEGNVEMLLWFRHADSINK